TAFYHLSNFDFSKFFLWRAVQHGHKNFLTLNTGILLIGRSIPQRLRGCRFCAFGLCLASLYFLKSTPPHYWLWCGCSRGIRVMNLFKNLTVVSLLVATCSKAGGFDENLLDEVP